MSETRTTVTITVNGRTVDAIAGEPLIEAVGRAGDYVPRFCYHPRMEPVGVCRMCLVEVEGPRGMTLQPSCYLKVADGMNVNTNSDKVKKAQDGVLEFLLANHPLDCPVCDKGGECPLQDQALSHGSGETRFLEEKRHFVKPISIGELVLLDRERCIQCSRCVRFQSDVAGEAEIAFAGRGDLTEVAPSPTEPFDSIFAGNTVQICPVGALTAKPYRFTARPWDLEQIESTCTGCAVGCRVAVQSSQNRLTRILGVDAEGVNHGWLCDKGRFIIDAVDGNEESRDVLSTATRITEPLVRRDGHLVPVSWSEALSTAAKLLHEANHTGVIGGAALTNEGAFAWERFARQVLRTENIDAQYGDGLDAQLVQALPDATIDEATRARVLITLTGDLREEAPVLYLRLRDAARRGTTSLIEISSQTSSLRALATLVLDVRPGESALVADALTGLSSATVSVPDEQLAKAKDLVGDGEGVVVVVSRANMAEDASVIEGAIRRFATAWPGARFLTVLRRANVRGALDMGLAPGLRPGRTGKPSALGRTTLQQLQAIINGGQDATVLLGGCLIGNVADKSTAVAALQRSKVIAVTGHGGATLEYADVVLPALVSHERTGSVTNFEGRVTDVAAKVVAGGAAWDDVAIAAELAREMGSSIDLDSVEEAARAIEASWGYPALAAVASKTEGVMWNGAISATSRDMDPTAFSGIRAVANVGFATSSVAVAESVSHRTAVGPQLRLDDVAAGTGGRDASVGARDLALVMARRLYDNGMAVQATPAFAPLRATAHVTLHPDDARRCKVEQGQTVKVSTSNGHVTAIAHTSALIPRGVAVFPFGAGGDHLVTQEAVTAVKVEPK